MRTQLLALVAAAVLAGSGAARAALPGGNLLQDPGAEQAAGGAIPGWTLKDGLTAVDYGNPDGFPGKEESARIGGGALFFSGGRSAVSTATQTVDVGGAATEIDAGRVQAKLAAWLGGYAGQSDRMALAATYRGASGNVLGRSAIPAVTVAQRKSQTVFIAVSATAAVPAGTRSIEVVLTATRDAGSWNDGMADNVTLTLADKGGPAAAATTAATTTAAVAPAGVNLVVNPGAEQAAAGQLPGWTVKDGFTSLAYGSDGGFPGADIAKAVGGGASFFTGGQSTRSTATQIVDLSGRAAAIDRGTLKATLSAYIGGFATQPDWAKVYATFRGASGNALGALAIGPVAPGARKSQTTLLYRAAAGKVPAGTRSVVISIVAVRGAGSWNDGNVDNVSLVLR